ncbi:chemotaxis protein CheB [Mucilaginibacter robiniae]|uniref:protein-glutamate methylesterase n=1 Tax=Mucilaginibacter robiniae TaxID=2728022 RepID=A0A7L5E4I7_9SPHI|nr:chemotaxis protein CheB [Mucilaginibacter robiniae]QJD97985.1 chemotaxis protein CheB [Mucilaginibacter robiniae]
MELSTDIVERWHQSDVLLLGGSAGSFKLLFRTVKSLAANLGKTVIIIIHRKKNYFSEIEKLFGQHSRMYLREICDKDVIKKNTIYIAPANYHTLIENEKQFSLDVSESVWYSKPSIDVTFDTAAEAFGNRCTAILLSGANQDGAEGLLKLRKKGSLTIVQDPSDAEMADMPNAAIHLKAADYILTAEDIFKLLQL